MIEATTAAEAAPEEVQREEAAQEPKPYAMPKPRVGQSVAWYPMAVTTARAHNAVVYRVGDNRVSLMSLEIGQLGRDLGDVPHVSDPILRSNEYVRKTFGGWDFNEYDKAQATQAKLLAERLAAIEKRLASVEGRKGK